MIPMFDGNNHGSCTFSLTQPIEKPKHAPLKRMVRRVGAGAASLRNAQLREVCREI